MKALNKGQTTLNPTAKRPESRKDAADKAPQPAPKARPQAQCCAKTSRATMGCHD